MKLLYFPARRPDVGPHIQSPRMNISGVMIWRTAAFLWCGFSAAGCSHLDIRNAQSQQYFTDVVADSHGLGTGSSRGREELPVPREKKTPREGPAGLRHVINVIRAPFIPIGFAAELIVGGLSHTVI